MTSQPITLIPKTPRDQARIVRFCSILEELAAELPDHDDAFNVSGLDQFYANVLHDGVSNQSKTAFTITTSCPHTKDGRASGSRAFISLEIKHPSGHLSYRHTDADRQIIAASPTAMIKKLSDLLRPLPDRAFAILNDEFHGPGDWNAKHPILPMLNTAYTSHNQFQTVMGFDTRLPAITGIFIPNKERHDWFFQKNTNHRGMTVHTRLKNPLSTPNLHPDVISQIGPYFVVQTERFSSQETSFTVAKHLTYKSFEEISSVDRMRHIMMLQKFADSISPPPPTPIRPIARR